MLESKLEAFLTDRFKEAKDIEAADQKLLFEEKKKSGKRFIDLVPQLSLPAQVAILKMMGEFHQLPFLDIDKCHEVDREALKLIPDKLIRHFRALPIQRVKSALTIAMADPTDVVLVDRLGQYAKCELAPVFAVPEAIDRAIERFLGPLDVLGQEIRKIKDLPREAQASGKGSETAVEATAAPASQTVEIVNLIVQKAVESRASDIHLEPSEKAFYVRYRIDGVLYDYTPAPPKSMEASLISRLKIMANLDIAEKRLPQDGRIQFRTKDKEVDLRISTFPTIYGENIVIRVLDHSGALLTLQDIGFGREELEKFERVVTLSSGIILVTGPTGSGKTTTLYAALSKINTMERHIMTLEDPVEYRLERIRQSQIDPKSGLTFARGLRSVMRQDPDVIMVGEIRDLETAAIAIQAALTGHLVLSTLHTNDAASAMTRLLDMGIEPFLVSSSLVCIVAQRLVRTLCKDCRKPYTPDKALLKEVAFPLEKDSSVHFFQKSGCDRCKKTGFQGRVGIFEVMIPDDEIRKLVVKKESAEVIKRAAIQKGMRTLRQDGLFKVQQGITTLDEIFRVAQEF
ncbi:MAG: Flp pilus assembly complex ATPase component TadA [Candidatus Omnitrophica bacterium]|nr:Flp pilus assembly complex ATPase component TadA [Candidatus Omnitrophota bacterium]